MTRPIPKALTTCAAESRTFAKFSRRSNGRRPRRLTRRSNKSLPSIRLVYTASRKSNRMTKPVHFARVTLTLFLGVLLLVCFAVLMVGASQRQLRDDEGITFAGTKGS